jgi:hypothetical protein
MPRRLAAGENVTVEVEGEGSEQRHALVSLPRQALIDTLKADALPVSHDVPNSMLPSFRE